MKVTTQARETQIMNDDRLDVYHPRHFRPRPKDDYSAGKPTPKQVKKRIARRKLEDLIELKKIEQEHSL